MQLSVFYCVMKQLTSPLEDNSYSLVRFRKDSKVGHNCQDIKGMKEMEVSIQRQHLILT